MNRMILALAFLAALAPLPAAEISLILGAAPEARGLSLVPETDEGRGVAATREGRDAVACVAGKAPGRYLYFKVIDGAFKAGAMPSVRLRLDYFDAGKGELRLEYDSMDEAKLPGAFKPMGLVSLTGANKWKTAIVVLKDARFAGRCNGSDFRILFPGDADVALGALAITEWKDPAAIPAPPPTWRVEATRAPTMDVVLSGFRVGDFGAKGDGVSDDTAPFQAALDAMAKRGGGTVFAPAGRYAIRGSLTLPTSVTLRGEWASPSNGAPVSGTVLMAFAGRGDSNGEPFLLLQPSSGVKDLAVWYPEQDARAIVPYPWCIKQAGGDNATAENLTLVNPYQGIRIGPEWNELHFVRSVFGSPLSTGIQFDVTTDIGRLENIHLSPDYWSASGLPGAPEKGGPHARWMLDHGTGLRMLRSDWEYGSFISVRGYQTGFEILTSPKGAPNAQYYAIRIEGCRTALRVVDANAIGLAFTACVFEGSEYGIATLPSFTAALLLHSSTVRGGVAAALLDGTARSSALFQRCRFEGGVKRVAGQASFLDCDFSGPGEALSLEEGVSVAIVAGCRFPAGKRAVDRSGSPLVRVSDEAVPPSRIPALAWPGDRPRKPARTELFVATEAPYGARGDGAQDDTAAIQRALDAAGKRGGGLVFLPGGNYAVRGNLHIPPGVELRGVYDVPHHTLGKGSVLRFFAGRGDVAAPPAIAMEALSGLRGVTVMYPEQKDDAFTPYPPTVQGRGHGIYVVNLAALNPWYLLDFKTFRCDGHLLDYVAGAPLKVGLAVGGGSRGGEVRNAQFNPHYWGRSPWPENKPKDMLKGNPGVWGFQKENLDAFQFGDCPGELQFQNFVFGSLYGLHFVEENGKGASGIILGHGTDGSKVSAVIDASAPEGLDFINAELVCMATTDKKYVEVGPSFKSEARFYNTLLWAQPETSARIRGGALHFELANFLDYGPFVVDGGSLSLVGATLQRNPSGGKELILRRAAAPCALVGNITPYGISVEGDRSQVRERQGTTRSRPLPEGTSVVSATLGKRVEAIGMAVVQKNGESENVPAVRGGRAAWESVVRPAHAKDTHMMYATVEFPGFKNGRARRVALSLDYFDEGGGELRVVYDSSDESVLVSRGNPGAWKEAGKVALGSSGIWKTLRLEVADAWFGGRCNGGDLRLEWRGASGNPALASISIRRLD
ncbi:MAG: hypothetical protein J0L75_11470 [Spirochaetes bacterium]|nr:hypothetical protein [Spirochaetota bacterium]